MCALPSTPTSPTARRRRSTLPAPLDFMQSLWAIVHALERTSKRMSTELGVTGPQRLVLRVVGLFPGISAGELATRLHLHPSTLTGILERLAAQQLLRRTADTNDRRRLTLHLTARGTQVNGRRQGTAEAAVAAALRRATDGDRAAAQRLLETVTAALVANGARPAKNR